MGYRAHSGFWAYFAGGAFEKTLDAIRGGVFTVSAALVPFLSDFEDIAYTSPDRPLQSMLDYAQPTVNANIALSHGYDGTGVAIALIDSGINLKKDLRNAAGLPRGTRLLERPANGRFLKKSKAENL